MLRVIIVYEIKRKMKLTKLQHSDVKKKKCCWVCRTQIPTVIRHVKHEIDMYMTCNLYLTSIQDKYIIASNQLMASWTWWWVHSITVVTSCVTIQLVMIIQLSNRQGVYWFQHILHFHSNYSYLKHNEIKNISKSDQLNDREHLLPLCLHT